MKIIFLQDRDSHAFGRIECVLRQAVSLCTEWWMPFSDLGGKRSASFELLSLCQLLKALAFPLSPVPS